MSKTLPIITALGGRSSVFNVLTQVGYDIKSLDTIRMWEQRGGIPSEPALLLAKTADERGLGWARDDFFRDAA